MHENNYHYDDDFDYDEDDDGKDNRKMIKIIIAMITYNNYDKK